MRVLGVIPARGGSKGVPRKNERPLAGRPLLAHTLDGARAARRLTRVIVTTDDERLAALATALGAEVPFLRDASLARDDTPMLPVVQDAVTRLAAMGDEFDAVCLLQPTSPIRREGLIDECIAQLELPHVDAAMTVLPVPHEYNPHWVYFRQDNGVLQLSTGETVPIPRRQELPPAFHRAGSVYVVRTPVLMSGSLYGTTLVGIEVDHATHVNIDTLADWERAEAVCGKMQKQ